MGYRELIKQIQHDSGFSDQESQEALEHTIAALAAHLTPDERQDLASQLPPELQIIALAGPVPLVSVERNLLRYYQDAYDLDEARAKKQLLTVWHVLKRAIAPGEINDILAQLPNETVAFLH